MRKGKSRNVVMRAHPPTIYSRVVSRLATGLAGAAAILGAVATAQDFGPRVREGSEYEVVDCLLQSPTRRLGAGQIYQPPRRLKRLVAQECLRLHGEYVAFDPSTYRDSLVLWKEQAETGDPEAQTYVGEFYEQGLGVPQDYVEAARWYQAAADQGFSRAQRSLAYLYEQGLGVEQDTSKAVNLYRRASGIRNDNLVFESDMRASQAESQRIIDDLAGRLEAQTGQVETLQSQLALTQQRLTQRRSDLATVESEVSDLKQQLATLDVSDAANRNAELESLQANLDARERELTRRMQDIAALESQDASQRASLAEQLRIASLQDDQLRSRLTEQSEEMRSLRDQLASAQNALYEAEQRESELTKAMASERLELLTASSENANQTEQQQQELAAREQHIAEQEAEIEKLREERRDALAQVAALREQEHALTATQADHESELDSSRAELVSMRQRLVETDQQVADLTATLEREREQFQQERERIAEREHLADASLQAELATRQGRLDDQESLIDSLRAEARSYRNQIDELERGRAASDSEPREYVALRSIQTGPSAQAIESSRRFRRDTELGEFYALVIGNAQYANLESLDTAKADALAISQVLEKRYGFHVKTLINATRADILGTLYELYQKEGSPDFLHENDSLLIYYAGHGELDASNSRGYWLPVDAVRGDRSKWISDMDITRIVQELPAKHVLIVADSCYSGLRESSVNLTFRNPDDDEELLKFLADSPSRTVLTSGGQQPVISDAGNGHSVFANYLLDLLEKNSSVLNAETLYSDLYGPVSQTAAQYGVEQAPQYSEIAFAGHEDGDFFFIPSS